MAFEIRAHLGANGRLHLLDDDGMNLLIHALADSANISGQGLGTRASRSPLPFHAKG